MKLWSKNNKLTSLVLINLLLTGSADLFAQGYWMEKAGGVTDDEGYSISLDDSNNSYTTGYFTSTANFGPFALTATGVSDIFVTKTDKNGIFRWAVRGGGTGSDRALAIKTDASGNSYVTGYYYNSATFGTHTITSYGLQDVFVAKYDRNGNVKWAVSAGGSESDIGNAISTDNQGNVVVTGQFAGSAQFGSITLNSTANNINVFIAKFDSANGNVIWAKAGVGSHTDRGLGVACDPNGNIYVTGQYSDSLTFDAACNSGLSNAIFLAKFNSAGTEQWITTAGAANTNIANAIAVDNNSNVYLTGNFSGVLSFFASSTTTLTSMYANGIFIAKYDPNANLLWSVADGSSNPLTSNSISLDGSGNAYITGNFECVMNGYADKYGQGTFNTVGSWDIFASEYSSTNGAWQWSRQTGGHKNNYAYGIAVNATGDVYTCGSFDQDMIIPITPSPGFLGYNAISVVYCNNNYCSDPFYSYFAQMYTGGNLDVFIAKPFNLARQTYDFYSRTGSVCSRPYEGVCIGLDYSDSCIDTVNLCSSGTISAISHTCDTICPNFSYLWSTGATSIGITVNTNGWYSVTQTSADGCFRSKDSIYVKVHSLPSIPAISDNYGINTNAINTKPIRVCGGPVVLSGHNNGSPYFYWSTPTGQQIDSLSITLRLGADSGNYNFNVVDSSGCSSANNVLVVIDSALPLIAPKIVCLNCKHDSALLCKGIDFELFPYDSISNPAANAALCMPPNSLVINKWSVNRRSVSFTDKTYCPDENSFLPADSGWYIITDSIVRNSPCSSDVHIVKDSIFVRLYPVPVDSLTITGKTRVCPGDKTWLVATGNGNTYWWVFGSSSDSALVGPGVYGIVSGDRSKNGCYNATSKTITVTTVPLPVVVMNPADGLVCPGDSVELSTSSADGSFIWEGPSGPLAGTANHIYVKSSGSYNCIQNDTENCQLLSNTVSVGIYTPPYLLASPNGIICNGDTAKITVVAPSDAVIQWQSPLSGSAFIQHVTASGTYSALVTSCGITTPCNVTISIDHPVAGIVNGSAVTICNSGDSVSLQATSGMALYTWNPGNKSGRVYNVKNPGTYSLSAVDSNGCTATASVIVYPSLTATVLSLVNEICTGDNSGSISIGVTGGSGVYTYSWSPVSGNTTSLSGLSSGSYTVSITDGNGCTKLLSAVITQAPSVLNASITTFSNVNCNGSNDGNATASVIGGISPYKYLWNPGGQTTQTVSGLSAGTYSVNVIDSVGCTKTTSITLTEPSVISATYTSSSASCSINNGSLAVNVIGGTAPYTYLWNPALSNSATQSGLSAGIYSVTINDSHGCFDTLSVTIGSKNVLTVSIKGKDSVCKGENVSLIASGATTYTWSTGINSSSINIKAENDTTLWVVGYSGPCVDSTSFNLNVYSSPVFEMTTFDTICSGKSVSVEAKIEGGRPPFTYQWNNEISANSPGPFNVAPVAPVTYIVTVTDGCSNHFTDSTAVKIAKDSKAGFIMKADTVASNEQVSFLNTSAGASSYNWDFGDGNTSLEEMPTHTYASVGTYKVTLISFNSTGCPDTLSKDIYVSNYLVIPNVFTPNGDGENDIFKVKIDDALCYDIKILNRWGDIMYQSEDINSGWNGLVRGNGEQAPEGAYYYSIDYCDSQNTHHSKQGYLELIRGTGGTK